MSVSPLDVHEGAWTEEEFLALSGERRFELLDGELLMSPSPGGWHQNFSSRLWLACEHVRPSELRVYESVNVRIGPDRILVPDLVVTDRALDDFVMLEAAEVLLALEIVSPGSVAADRAVKPRLYAEAGIPHYVRIEPDGPSAVIGRLTRDRYAFAEPSPLLRLVDPFEWTVDLPALLAADRAV